MIHSSSNSMCNHRALNLALSQAHKRYLKRNKTMPVSFSLQENFQAGDKLEIEVKHIDLQAKRVSLRLPGDSGYVSFEEVAAGQLYWGKVRLTLTVRVNFACLCVYLTCHKSWQCKIYSTPSYRHNWMSYSYRAAVHFYALSNKRDRQSS